MKNILVRVLTIGFAGLFALAGAACDSSQVTTAGPSETAFTNSLIQSNFQQAEPGRLWRMAAAVHDTLSEEQFAQMEQRLRSLSQRRGDRRGWRGRRPDRPGMRGRSGMAQDRPNMRGHRPRGPRQRAIAQLDLTDEQKETLSELRAERRSQMRPLMQQWRDGSISGEAFRNRRQEHRAEMREQLMNVLTEEQRQRLADFRAQRQERREQARAVRVEILNLTDEQEAQLDTLRGAPGRGMPPFIVDYDAWKAALAEVLNEEQVEIAVVHAALRVKMHARRMQGQKRGGRRGPRRGPGGR